VFTRSLEPVRLDLDGLRRQMTRGRTEAAAVYARCDAIGLHYGPAHRGITSIHQGESQLLAELRLPAGLEQHHYVLHPSLMDSALQASLGLFVDWNAAPGKPPVPFGLASLRILSPSTRDMFAWVRYSQNRNVDIDLCDTQGTVCVQMRGLASRALDGSKPSRFDDAFYETLIADVVNQKVSVDDAAALG
jgi:hypothetical protein